MLSDFRFRWTAFPGFDLNIGWGVPLRAYLESWLIIRYTNDYEAGYPGYLRATPELLDRGSPEWAATPFAKRYVRAFKGKPQFDLDAPIIGNEDLHVLRVEQIPNGFRAFVCDTTFGVYQHTTSGYVPIVSHNFTTNADKADVDNTTTWRIEFSNREPVVESSPPSPTAPQTGPLPAPVADVFGPWFVTGADEPRFWPDTDHPGLKQGSPEDRRYTDEAIATQDAMQQECLNRYPLDAAQRAKQATTILTSAPPIQPAAPGWPEKE